MQFTPLFTIVTDSSQEKLSSLFQIIVVVTVYALHLVGKRAIK